MPVHFYFEQRTALTRRIPLKQFIESIFKSESKKLASLSYIFCSDKYLLKLNKQHLAHDYYTDIISFDLSETNKSPTIGEIYISIDRVRENAQNLAIPISQELHRVIFHGALHLCGFKDKTKVQITEMRNKENYYLKKYNLLT